MTALMSASIDVNFSVSSPRATPMCLASLIR